MADVTRDEERVRRTSGCRGVRSGTGGRQRSVSGTSIRRHTVCGVWPPLPDEHGRRGRVERQRGSTEGPRELRELGPPHAESVEAVGLGHEDALAVAFESDAALVAEDRDAIDEPEDEIEPVLDQQQRALARRTQAFVRGDDLPRAGRIEVRGRLVEHDPARAHREQGRERDALLRAAGEPIELPRCPAIDARRRARLAHALTHLVAWDPEVLEAEGDLVISLEHHQLRLGILEEDADGRREPRESRGPRVRAVDGDRAALPVRVDAVRDHPIEAERERALSRTARSEQEQTLALVPVEVEVTERRPLPTDVPDGERPDARERCQTSRTFSRPNAK